MHGPLRAFGRVLPLRGRALVQGAALLAATGLAANGARILNDSPRAGTPVLDNFDQSMPWLGAALLATLVAAWRPASPVDARPRREVLTAFLRTHWVELALFALILGFGAFMRLYRFEGSLPPSDGLCCEENINAGVAYRALEGERPLLFPLGRWGSAAGFLAFGETTLGLRFFFPLMAIATLAFFYLLLRQIVSVPAALFGLALYAAAWWPALRARQPAEGTIYTVLFALLLVRGLRTGSPLMFFGAGVLAGLLSYEYEAFKVVPIIAAGFVAAAALREVALRGPRSLEAARRRAAALLRAAWQPALVFFLVVGIVLVPMVVGEAHGHDLYLASVHRNEGTRGSRLTDDWEDQLKWVAEIFLPVGPNEYPSATPRDVGGTELLDPLTGWLALAGVVVGLVSFARGYRLLFVAWMLLSLAAGALVLANFAPWKFIGLVPVAIVLAALLLDDLRGLVVRWLGERGGRAFGALLLAGAAFSFWWNADTLFNEVGPSAAVQASYGGEAAAVYALCDDVRRDGGAYAFAFMDVRSLAGFAAPQDAYAQQRIAWGDSIWACHDLRGTALPAAEEAWPLRAVPNGPVALAFSRPLGPADELIQVLNRAYPGLGRPDRLVVGPGERFTYLGYRRASVAELFQYGLWAEYLPVGGAEPAASRVDPVHDLSWEEDRPPLAPPFTVRWRGVIHVEQEARLSLRLAGDGPAQVLLDGQLVASTGDPDPQAFLDLVPGWHPVEVTLDKQTPGGGARLLWIAPDGEQRPVAAQDLFPLRELEGWVHQRALGFPGDPQRFVSQRLDFAPHFSLAPVVERAARRNGSEPLLTEERWRSVWQLEAPGDYLLKVEFLSGTVTVLVDGEDVATGEAPGPIEAGLRLTRGPHTIELVQEYSLAVRVAGARLSVVGGGDAGGVPFEVRPY